MKEKTKSQRWGYDGRVFL